MSMPSRLCGPYSCASADSFRTTALLFLLCSAGTTNRAWIPRRSPLTQDDPALTAGTNLSNFQHLLEQLIQNLNRSSRLFLRSMVVMSLFCHVTSSSDRWLPAAHRIFFGSSAQPLPHFLLQPLQCLGMFRSLRTGCICFVDANCLISTTKQEKLQIADSHLDPSTFLQVALHCPDERTLPRIPCGVFVPCNLTDHPQDPREESPDHVH